MTENYKDYLAGLIKTLKDIDLTEIESDFEIDGTDYTQRDIKKLLKQEAIKWVRNRLQKASKFIPPETEFGYNMAQAKVLYDFFNLTSEDLE